MRQNTLSKWKRDALEVEWDYKPEIDTRAKEAIRQARRVMMLIDELRSMRVIGNVYSKKAVLR